VIRTFQGSEIVVPNTYLTRSVETQKETLRKSPKAQDIIE
jgi:hypothetical protein